MKAIKIRLSDAQQSAMECRDWSEEPTTKNAWQGAHLSFTTDQAETIFGDLVDASNAEDAQHQIEKDKLAGRAARSLAALAGKVLDKAQACPE